jgi:hypothetical protein
MDDTMVDITNHLPSNSVYRGGHHYFVLQPQN